MKSSLQKWLKGGTTPTMTQKQENILKFNELREIFDKNEEDDLKVKATEKKENTVERLKKKFEVAPKYPKPNQS